MTQKNNKDVLLTIRSFMKSAEAHTEAGGFEGSTQHPTKSVDDRTQAAQEGARSKENTEGVKDEQGKASVDATPVAKAGSLLKNVGKLAKKAEGTTPAAVTGSAADDHLQIGTKVAPTGDDPANETSSAKGGKEDPGSTHPARTDNDQLDGHKYACDADTPLTKIATMVDELSSLICKDVLAASDMTQKRASVHTPTPTNNQNWPEDHSINFQVGQELADLWNGSMDKVAAERMICKEAEEIIRRALLDGENVGNYMFKLAQHNAAKTKKANDPSMGGAPGGGVPTGGIEAMMGGGMGGMGGGGMEGGGMGGGGDPLAAALGSGGGGEMGGGMMGAEAGGGGGGGGGVEEALESLDEEQLMALLAQAGIKPEEIMAAAEAGGGGGEMMGGGAGGGSIMPTEPSATEGGASKPEEKSGSAKKPVTTKSATEDITDFFRELNAKRRQSA